MATEPVIILSVVIGLAIILWLFLEGEMIHLWPVEQVTNKILKAKTKVWGVLTLGGITLLDPCVVVIAHGETVEENGIPTVSKSARGWQWRIVEG